MCLGCKGKTLLGVVKKLLLPQVNFPANNLNFQLSWRWWDWIQAIFLNLFYFTIFRGHWNIFQEWKYFAIDILYELDKNSICCVHQNKTFLFGNLANGLSWPVAGDFIEQWNLVESLHFCPAFSLIHKLRHFMPFFLFFQSKQEWVYNIISK